MESTMATSPAEPNYPMTLEIPRPERQSRLTNFPLGIGWFIRLILLIPHLLVIWALGLVAGVVGFIADFAILFTGKYPEGMFNFVKGVQRWGVNVSAYTYHLRDEYPPFSMEAGNYPVAYDVAYPASLNRILNFPVFGYWIKWVLVIPHFIVLAFLALVVYLLLFIATFAILFTGSFPDGMHKFVVGFMRWGQRINVYVASMTDKYPPFSMN